MSKNHHPQKQLTQQQQKAAQNLYQPTNNASTISCSNLTDSEDQIKNVIKSNNQPLPMNLNVKNKHSQIVNFNQHDLEKLDNFSTSLVN